MAASAATRLVVLLLAVATCTAKLIIFGDSLSDGGVTGIVAAEELVNNHFSTSPINVGVYPPTPYYFGRFTNGYIWADVAASALGQEIDNYAAGGSNGLTSGEISVDPPFAYVTSPTRVASRSLLQQAEAYAALNGEAAPASDIVVVFTGVDEYFQQFAVGTGTPNVSDVIDAIDAALRTAYDAGARRFVVADLPPLASFPFAGTNANALGSLANTHNSQLTSMLNTFNSTNGGSSVSIYNVSSLFSAVLATPANYANPTAFTNTNAACRAGNLDTVQAAGFAVANCPNADAYVFFDEVHPTKHMHQVIGQDFAAKTQTVSSAAATAA